MKQSHTGMLLRAALSAGDHVVAARAMFGSCLHVVTDILPRFGITHTLVEGGDIAQWQAAMKPHTRMLFLGPPSTPPRSLVAMRRVAQCARSGVW